IRPSAVRSNSAPHASSSRTRSGASFACSSAMRQLLMYCPPRMVSAKCTFQESRSSTLARAAATPPSAMTVWALPRSDLQTSPTETPCAAASMAARRPAPPAPITRTSCSCVSYSGMAIVVPRLEDDPEIADHAHGHEPDVEVGEPHAEEREPGEGRMALVEPGEQVPEPVARGRLGEAVDVAPAHVAAGVAGE